MSKLPCLVKGHKVITESDGSNCTPECAVCNKELPRTVSDMDTESWIEVFEGTPFRISKQYELDHLHRTCLRRRK